MKIRWSDGSVRFRITPSELENLQQGEAVVETLAIAGSGQWSARIAPNAPETDLRFENGGLLVQLTQADVANLSAPEAEGVYFRREDESPVRYYIEKDFPCAHPRPAEAAEPASETFAPPEGFQKC